jgi:hypothetical protein
MVDVVVNASAYLRTLPQVIQQASNPLPDITTKGLLKDFPNCGIRNNDTFNTCPSSDPTSSECDPINGGQANASWSLECLWDCEWQVNPHFGKIYNLTEEFYNISVLINMPKVPVDLRCLDGCTTSNFFPIDLDIAIGLQQLDCSNASLFPSFIACYLKYSQFEYLWYATDYFDMSVESCLLAILEPDLYSDGKTCDQLGVRLWVFNPDAPPPYLVSSISSGRPSPVKLATAPNTQEVASVINSIVPLSQVPLKRRHPWLCSLQTQGYVGIHRCGVTILSGPPQATIFVSTAHCNYLCKNAANQVVQLCCCQLLSNNLSCQGNYFCGANATLQLAQPDDLSIVCNITTQESAQGGIRLPILKIINHPNYTAISANGTYKNGPVGGYDISVYIVDDSAFFLDQDYIWPACLPKTEKTYLPGNRGILSGWISPQPTFNYNQAINLLSYSLNNLYEREALLERLKCSDPAWMNSSTFYPPGTTCYTDAAWASSVEFGNSGSGIMRPFLYSNENGTREIRYSWAGPLSMSRGSDLAIRATNVSFIQSLSGNPDVFTDAHCYMDWIAAQYNLSLPADHVLPATCSQSSGSQAVGNNSKCLSRTFQLYTGPYGAVSQCDFSTSERCQQYTYNPQFKPAPLLNVFTCTNVNGLPAICANDCIGVDPNAIVVGGAASLFALPVAAVAAGGAASPGFLAPVLGAGSILAMLGLGSMAMNSTRSTANCPSPQCLTLLDRRCCATVLINNRRVCPMLCNTAS